MSKMKIKSYRKLVIFISLSFISLGLFLTIGLFNNSFYTLDIIFSHFFSPTVKQGKPPDPLTSQIQDVSGKVQSLFDVRGDITLISFWASWCGPCRVELPTLLTLHQKLESKGLRILAINVEDKTTDQEKINQFWEMMNLPFSFFFDFEKQVSKAFNIQSLPMHLILDRDGQVVVTANGANDWSHPRNVQMIQELLSQNTM